MEEELISSQEGQENNKVIDYYKCADTWTFTQLIAFEYRREDPNSFFFYLHSQDNYVTLEEFNLSEEKQFISKIYNIFQATQIDSENNNMLQGNWGILSLQFKNRNGMALYEHYMQIKQKFENLNQCEFIKYLSYVDQNIEKNSQQFYNFFISLTPGLKYSNHQNYKKLITHMNVNLELVLDQISMININLNERQKNLIHKIPKEIIFQILDNQKEMKIEVINNNEIYQNKSLQLMRKEERKISPIKKVKVEKPILNIQKKLKVKTFLEKLKEKKSNYLYNIEKENSSEYNSEPIGEKEAHKKQIDQKKYSTKQSSRNKRNMNLIFNNILVSSSDIEQKKNTQQRKKKYQQSYNHLNWSQKQYFSDTETIIIQKEKVKRKRKKASQKLAKNKIKKFKCNQFYREKSLRSLQQTTNINYENDVESKNRISYENLILKIEDINLMEKFIKIKNNIDINVQKMFINCYLKNQITLIKISLDFYKTFKQCKTKIIFNKEKAFILSQVFFKQIIKACQINTLNFDQNFDFNSLNQQLKRINENMLLAITNGQEFSLNLIQNQIYDLLIKRMHQLKDLIELPILNIMVMISSLSCNKIEEEKVISFLNFTEYFCQFIYIVIQFCNCNNENVQLKNTTEELKKKIIALIKNNINIIWKNLFTIFDIFQVIESSQYELIYLISILMMVKYRLILHLQRYENINDENFNQSQYIKSNNEMFFQQKKQFLVTLRSLQKLYIDKEASITLTKNLFKNSINKSISFETNNDISICDEFIFQILTKNISNLFSYFQQLEQYQNNKVQFNQKLNQLAISLQQLFQQDIIKLMKNIIYFFDLSYMLVVEIWEDLIFKNYKISFNELLLNELDCSDRVFLCQSYFFNLNNKFFIDNKWQQFEQILAINYQFLKVGNNNLDQLLKELFQNNLANHQNDQRLSIFHMLQYILSQEDIQENLNIKVVRIKSRIYRLINNQKWEDKEFFFWKVSFLLIFLYFYNSIIVFDNTNKKHYLDLFVDIHSQFQKIMPCQQEDVSQVISIITIKYFFTQSLIQQILKFNTSLETNLQLCFANDLNMTIISQHQQQTIIPFLKSKLQNKPFLIKLIQQYIEDLYEIIMKFEQFMNGFLNIQNIFFNEQKYGYIQMSYYQTNISSQFCFSEQKIQFFTFEYMKICNNCIDFVLNLLEQDQNLQIFAAHLFYFLLKIKQSNLIYFNKILLSEQFPLSIKRKLVKLLYYIIKHFKKSPLEENSIYVQSHQINQYILKVYDNENDFNFCQLLNSLFDTLVEVQKQFSYKIIPESSSQQALNDLLTNNQNFLNEIQLLFQSFCKLKLQMQAKFYPSFMEKNFIENDVQVISNIYSLKAKPNLIEIQEGKYLLTESKEHRLRQGLSLFAKFFKNNWIFTFYKKIFATVKLNASKQQIILKFMDTIFSLYLIFIFLFNIENCQKSLLIIEKFLMGDNLLFHNISYTNKQSLSQSFYQLKIKNINLENYNNSNFLKKLVNTLCQASNQENLSEFLGKLLKLLKDEYFSIYQKSDQQINIFNNCSYFVLKLSPILQSLDNKIIMYQVIHFLLSNSSNQNSLIIYKLKDFINNNEKDFNKIKHIFDIRNSLYLQIFNAKPNCKIKLKYIVKILISTLLMTDNINLTILQQILEQELCNSISSQYLTCSLIIKQILYSLSQNFQIQEFFHQLESFDQNIKFSNFMINGQIRLSNEIIIQIFKLLEKNKITEDQFYGILHFLITNTLQGIEQLDIKINVSFIFLYFILDFEVKYYSLQILELSFKIIFSIQEIIIKQNQLKNFLQMDNNLFFDILMLSSVLLFSSRFVKSQNILDFNHYFLLKSLSYEYVATLIKIINIYDSQFVENFLMKNNEQIIIQLGEQNQFILQSNLIKVANSIKILRAVIIIVSDQQIIEILNKLQQIINDKLNDCFGTIDKNLQFLQQFFN